MFHQACDYGPIIGRVHFLKSGKTPQNLQVCSVCGKVTMPNYGVPTEELFAYWERQRISFKFLPDKCFRKEKLSLLCISLTSRGIDPHKLIPAKFLQEKKKTKEALALVEV